MTREETTGGTMLRFRCPRDRRTIARVDRDADGLLTLACVQKLLDLGRMGGSVPFDHTFRVWSERHVLDEDHLRAVASPPTRSRSFERSTLWRATCARAECSTEFWFS